MGELVLFALLAIFALFVLPIIILVQIGSLKSEIRNMNRRINDLLMSGTKTAVPDNNVRVEATDMPTSLARDEEDIEKDVVEDEHIAYMPSRHVSSVVEEEDVPVYSMPETVYSQTLVSDVEPVAESEYEEEQAQTQVPDVQAPLLPPPPVSEKADTSSFFEKISGANLLSKIGIVTLVLGIGFFVKYAIDQEWINEIGRVGIGLFTGGLIIAIAHKLKAKYSVFSSILVGGGISVFYITITLAFREYALFSQTVAFIMLIAVTIFSVLLSLLYDRKELAVFSLLGGFAAPLMVSTGSGNYIVLFSYILILNAGMLVVSYMKKWRVVGIVSYVLTLISFWSWTLISYENQYLNVSLFVSLFFIQFYILALFDHFKSGKKISAYQVFLILTNNLSAFSAYLYVIDDYSSDIRGLITIVLAAVNAIVLVVLFRNSRVDRNMVYLIIAIVLSFVSLAIPIQLKGHVITMFWAAESVILLWLWQKSRIKVFYAGFFLIAALTLFSYLMDMDNLYSFSNDMPIMSNRLFVTGIVVLISFVVNMLLLRREPTRPGANTLLIRMFKVIVIILAYGVPCIELNLQLENYTDVDSTSSFRYVALATFTTIYIAVLGVIYNKKVSSYGYVYGFLYLTVCIYAVLYAGLITDLRSDIFMFATGKYPAGYFSIHLLSLPAVAYIIYLLVKNIKAYSGKKTWLSWLLTIVVVAILSVETDNIVVWMVGNNGNYWNVLYDVHSFGYPILWGIIAMGLMIWGLHGKEALLRKISLVFFGLIIVKFYIYDVWEMSQMGRILSFVMLGVILLLVSFLQQKIRTLVKNDDVPEIEEDKHDNMPEVEDDNNGQQFTNDIS